MFHNLLSGYLSKFSAQGVKYGYGLIWTKEEITNRVKLLMEQNPEKKLINLLDYNKNKEIKIKSAVTELKLNKEDASLINSLRLFIYLRTYRTDMLSFSLTYFFPVLNEIGKRNNLKLRDILECSPDEIVNYDFPSKHVIWSRSKKSIVRAIDGVPYIICNERASVVKDKIIATIGGNKNIDFNKMKLDKIITGTVANKGRVSGIVKIVLNNSELSKIRIGDILVSPMTTPDFVPAMEKATGFITDEGGILCHAAIISREMGKPCIIGTKYAIKLLEDGVQVELDATRGVVKILKKENI